MTTDTAAVRARVAAATPGPWFAYIKDDVISVGTRKFGRGLDAIIHWAGFDSCRTPLEQQRANAVLIARAPTDLLAMCDEIEGLRKALRDSVFAIEATLACLNAWNGGIGSPANCLAIIERARAALGDAT